MSISTFIDPNDIVLPVEQMRVKARQAFFNGVELGMFRIAHQFKDTMQSEWVVYDIIDELVDPHYQDMKAVTGSEFDWLPGFYCDPQGNVFVPYHVLKVERDEIKKAFSYDKKRV